MDTELKGTLTAVIAAEGEWFVARCLEVEVTSQGESVQESLDNLREALELYFEDVPFPRSAHPLVASVDVRVPA